MQCNVPTYARWSERQDTEHAFGVTWRLYCVAESLPQSVFGHRRGVRVLHGTGRWCKRYPLITRAQCAKGTLRQNKFRESVGMWAFCGQRSPIVVRRPADVAVGTRLSR